MLFQFFQLCQKTVPAFVINLQKHYNKYPRHKRKIIPLPQPTETADQLGDKAVIPIITCKRNEYNFYKGQSFPTNKALPLGSRGWFHKKSKGDYFFLHPQETSNETSIDEPSKSLDFYQFDINHQLCDKLKELGITQPTEVQKKGIPKILAGHNTLLAMETGCGKTLAYLLPLLNQILEWKLKFNRPHNTPLGLILLPTRELAVQIGIDAKKISRHLKIRTRILIGGRTKRKMYNPHVEDVDLVIASFGVISKLTSVRIYDMSSVRHLVLDEADALFHVTFEEKLQAFMKKIPINTHQDVHENSIPLAAQVTLVSATFPSRIKNIMGDFIDIDSLHCVTSDKLHQINVLQKFMRVGKSQKPMELLKFLKPKIANKEPVIVFTNENKTCHWMSVFLNDMNIEHARLTGSMPLRIRNGQYEKFINGHVKVLITTNAGSRGLDTTMVRHILNYDFPLETTDYIHRCGRTARLGGAKDCRVTNFISGGAEISLVMKIEYAIKKMRPFPIISMLPQDDEGRMEASPSTDDLSMLEEEEEEEEEEMQDLDEIDKIPH